MTGFESDFDDVDDAPSVDDLWSAVVELTARIDDLATQLGPGYSAGGRPDTVFDSADSWVENWFSAHVARDLAGRSVAWCSRWQEHPEAASRIGAMWERWEELQAEWAGMSMWWREADQHIAVVLSPGGPFAQCKAGSASRHRRPPNLPVELGATEVASQSETLS